MNQRTEIERKLDRKNYHEQIKNQKVKLALVSGLY